MRRVLPFTIIEFIDQAFPEILQQSGATATPYDRIGELRVLLRLLENLDAALWPAGDGSPSFLIAWEKIRNHVEGWVQHGKGCGGHLEGDQHRKSPLWTLRRTLQDRAPAVAVPESTPPLAFITGDDEFRLRLREDVASAEATFADGHFKASTVMAGSVAEALLLAAIQRRPASDVESAIRARKLKPRALEDRYFAELIAIAKHLGLFSEETLHAAEVAKDFRNLIHAGREQRRAANSSRGTAQAALAAMNLLIHESTRRT